MHAAMFCLSACLLAGDAGREIARPECLDTRLKIELFAAEPDIVTPCGLAVDERGRVLVVESHTHFRPKDYQGPPADRIRMFEDRDGDGRAERITTFFEGTTHTMNVGLHPDGSLYVATRSEVFRLRDTDDDGTADERTPIARLRTRGNYPHNGLSGFAFDVAGNVYFGLGENLGSPFRLIGSDGSIASDLEGGQIYRCRADGSGIEMVAFGFWNPFHLAFDAFGRLFAVDNDPDSLPPCRLMHIVVGGNYGYRYRNGRKGVHPFTAWNGELPGTLPMVAGTGEAPSGMVVYESDQLPAEYVGDLLVTSWGNHRLERYRLEPRGASFQAVTEPIVQGDTNFRPVGIAVAPDGSLFVSDWVLPDYPLHGKGRIWHITAPAANPPERPPANPPRDAITATHRPLREQAARQLAESAEGRRALEQLAANHAVPRVRSVALAALATVDATRPLLDAAHSDQSIDVRTAALRYLSGRHDLSQLISAEQPPEVRAEAMRRPAHEPMAEALWQSTAAVDAFVAQAARRGLASLNAVGPGVDPSAIPPQRRLASLLILRETNARHAIRLLPQFLRDPDADVRFAAVQWVGEERLTQLRPALLKSLSAGPATARLFGGYLAALERLDGSRRDASDEWGPQQYIARALENRLTGGEVRRFALRMLDPDHPVLSVERLREYLDSDDDELQLEAVRTLRDSRHPNRTELLTQIASSTARPEQLRAEAIVGLAPDDDATRSLLFTLAGEASAVLRSEALRSLRGCDPTPVERELLADVARRDTSTAQLVERIVGPAASAAPATNNDVEAWISALAGPDGRIDGDPRAGGRIFFHRHAAGCASCHQIGGRGARIGPELTYVKHAAGERRLIESIVHPSREVAPQFVAWSVATTDGRQFQGVLVDEEPTGAQTYADQQGKFIKLEPQEIASRRAQPVSIMPEGLAGQMTLQEFRDLLAFLRGTP